jgi:hypothetical protein
MNNKSIAAAFDAAANVKGFQLFFSFDYAGRGAWSKADVLGIIQSYASRTEYYKHGGKPLVSTFEGSANAEDWKSIKAQTGCFFIPDWSSLGAQAAMALGVADGLFNWAAWPVGPSDMNTYVDASYVQFLQGKPYMMPVSPWFFTNLPGYDKNWLWRGDDLWFERWVEVWTLAPEFVQIISWNDYGESHYIGPLQDSAYVAFDVGKAPFNYVQDMPHDGWRTFLPFLIDTYKHNISSISTEGVVAWFRINPSGSCGSGGTTGDTASHLHIEYEPDTVVQDKVFFSALLTSPADAFVSIGGGTSEPVSWTRMPNTTAGIYHGSLALNGRTGKVIVTIKRSGSTVVEMEGKRDITRDCTKGVPNWNAWVGYSTAPASGSVTPSAGLADQGCIEGDGAKGFDALCKFACSRGYCPIGACTCRKVGLVVDENLNKTAGYSKNGDANYGGLCSFSCERDFCPEQYCTRQGPATPYIPKTSPFLPNSPTGGTGQGATKALCEFTCKYGYCPIRACTRTSQGVLNLPPPARGREGNAISDDMTLRGLCKFACPRGICPSEVCRGGFDGPAIYIGDEVWSQSPIIQAEPPAHLVIAPSPLPAGSSVTISIPPLETSLEVGWIDGTTYVSTTGESQPGILHKLESRSLCLRPRTCSMILITMAFSSYYNILHCSSHCD